MRKGILSLTEDSRVDIIVTTKTYNKYGVVVEEELTLNSSFPIQTVQDLIDIKSNIKLTIERGDNEKSK